MTRKASTARRRGRGRRPASRSARSGSRASSAPASRGGWSPAGAATAATAAAGTATSNAAARSGAATGPEPAAAGARRVAGRPARERRAARSAGWSRPRPARRGSPSPPLSARLPGSPEDAPFVAGEIADRGPLERGAGPVVDTPVREQRELERQRAWRDQATKALTALAPTRARGRSTPTSSRTTTTT